jgi:hypothetical protein
MGWYYFAISILLLLGWMFAFPQEGYALLQQLKQHWRRWLIKKHGTKATELLAGEFHRKAQQTLGNEYDPDLIEEILASERDQLVEKKGRQYLAEKGYTDDDLCF